MAPTPYRVVVHAAYRLERLLLPFASNHRGYDRIDAETV
jgi:mRNA-degrading endonuclease HigB of HigAB toxin-antitoxin module